MLLFQGLGNTVEGCHNNISGYSKNSYFLPFKLCLASLTPNDDTLESWLWNPLLANNLSFAGIFDISAFLSGVKNRLSRNGRDSPLHRDQCVGRVS